MENGGIGHNVPLTWEMQYFTRHRGVRKFKFIPPAGIEHRKRILVYVNVAHIIHLYFSKYLLSSLLLPPLARSTPLGTSTLFLGSEGSTPRSPSCLRWVSPRRSIPESIPVACIVKYTVYWYWCAMFGYAVGMDWKASKWGRSWHILNTALTLTIPFEALYRSDIMNRYSRNQIRIFLNEGCPMQGLCSYLLCQWFNFTLCLCVCARV